MKREYFKPILEIAEYDIEKEIALNPLSLFGASEDEEGESYEDVVWQ